MYRVSHIKCFTSSTQLKKWYISTINEKILVKERERETKTEAEAETDGEDTSFSLFVVNAVKEMITRNLSDSLPIHAFSDLHSISAFFLF